MTSSMLHFLGFFGIFLLALLVFNWLTNISVLLTVVVFLLIVFNIGNIENWWNNNNKPKKDN